MSQSEMNTLYEEGCNHLDYALSVDAITFEEYMDNLYALQVKYNQ
jgi:hypothetical protein